MTGPVDLVLLRAGLLPDLPLTPGTVLHAKVVEPPQAAGQGPAPASGVPPEAFAFALPGGAQARVHVQEREEAGRGRRGAARTVVVRYDSPTLGRLDVRLDASSAAVHVLAGEPAERVRGASQELADALARLVTVLPRSGSYDASA